jgi:hypothetical protein
MVSEGGTARKRNPWWVWVLAAAGAVLLLHTPVAVALFYLGWWPFN